LLRNRTVYAHGIYLDDADRALLRDTGSAIAVSPTSNLFLGRGFFDYAGAERVGFRFGLASDVGGGTSFSPFHTMLAAYTVGRTTLDGLQTKSGLSLSPQHLWWQHTAGAARALGLQGIVGNLQPGRPGSPELLGTRGPQPECPGPSLWQPASATAAVDLAEARIKYPKRKARPGLILPPQCQRPSQPPICRS
jgi:cytosine/adenosine deaminase-related metal-dependent hydrolase